MQLLVRGVERVADAALAGADGAERDVDTEELAEDAHGVALAEPVQAGEQPDGRGEPRAERALRDIRRKRPTGHAAALARLGVQAMLVDARPDLGQLGHLVANGLCVRRLREVR